MTVKNIVLIGAQWGDEGKGRFVDYLAQRADVVVRYQGGNNAGHTVGFDGRVFKLHLVPSGVFYPGKLNVIGNGVVVNPVALMQEMRALKEQGVDGSSLRISDRAHMVLPYHTREDELFEAQMGEAGIGTTLRGIGPAYTDKAQRIGLRMGDLTDMPAFAERLRAMVEQKNRHFAGAYGQPPLEYEPMLAACQEAAAYLRPYICDTIALLHQSMRIKKNILFEGAQGTLLDLDLGTYPYVTSSHPTAGGATIGAGVGPTAIDGVLGVVKAYTTRVGKGPFVTELTGAQGDAIREKGQEYGATTGRPRRCGWLDGAILQYAAQVNGLTHLAVTRMDTLGGLGDVQLCTGYQIDGKPVAGFPARLEDLQRCTPVYETLPGWTDQISDIRGFDELPAAAQGYIRRIEALAGAPVAMIGVGPQREQVILRDPLFD